MESVFYRNPADRHSKPDIRKYQEGKRLHYVVQHKVNQKNVLSVNEKVLDTLYDYITPNYSCQHKPAK